MKSNNEHRRPRAPQRVISAILICVTFISLTALSSSAASEYSSVPIFLNGEQMKNVNGLLINSITYVPLRAFCDEAASETHSGEFKIYWDERTSSAVVEGKDFYLIASQGKCYITVNGRYFYTVGNIMNVDGRIYVPIRPMAKALGLELLWNNINRSVELTSTGKRTLTSAEVYNESDVYWLSRIICAEAGGEPFLGKMAVGNVVINRKNHADYPNTIYGVIFDRKYGTQFTPAATGTIYNTPNTDSIIAAKICLEGYSLSNTALFFLNPRIATNFWIVKNRPFEFRIGNHDFYG